ncbi:MAG: hypothetical protein H8D97_00660 [Proteobacteria bacterium]|nr:hypothetical protein [Pseudomonadota bacterium]
MSNQSPEIIQYIRYNRGERRHLIGAMIAFKRDRTSNKFYIGWSLKHKDDWALYNNTCHCIKEKEKEKDNNNELDYDPIIIGTLPFNKDIALNTARKRGINWAMAPCEAPKIPDSIRDEFIIFLDRSMRYFKVSPQQQELMPEWIPSDINNDGFKDIVDDIYQKRNQQRINTIRTLRSDLKWHTEQTEMLIKKIEKLSSTINV